MVADEQAAERALERTLVETGALLLQPRQFEITPSLAYTHSEAFAVVSLGPDGADLPGSTTVRQEVLESELSLRFGLPFDAQVEFCLPYSWTERSTVNRAGFAEVASIDDRQSGLGDLTVGLAKTLAQERGRWPDLVGRVLWQTGSGSDPGGEAVSLQLNATKRLDPLVFAGAIYYTRPFEFDDIEPGDEFGYSISALLAAGPETSLRFGFSHSFIDQSKYAGSVVGSDFSTAYLNIGASVITGARQFVDVGGAFGLTDESSDFVIRASIPMRFSF